MLDRRYSLVTGVVARCTRCAVRRDGKGCEIEVVTVSLICILATRGRCIIWLLRLIGTGALSDVDGKLFFRGGRVLNCLVLVRSLLVAGKRDIGACFEKLLPKLYEG